MGNSKQTNKNLKPVQKSKNNIILIIGLAVFLVIGFFIFKGNGGSNSSSTGSTSGDASGDLKIVKSEITDTVKFYPYKAGKTNMEVMAVKASDGTIRTAFNTCQVCYDSGKGYYKQQGNEVICQNCGNRFKLDQIEKIKGGCNPVPIMKEDKTDDGTNITIAKTVLEKNKGLFGNWKK